MLRQFLIGLLVEGLRRLGAVEDDEPETIEDLVNPDFDQLTTETVGPVELSVDWEGDVVHIEPATDDPAERFAVCSYLRHARLEERGVEVRARG